MKMYAVTDIGMSRSMNQDYFFAFENPVGNLPNLFIVADGMGGHAAGEFASRFAVEEMVRCAEEDASADIAEVLCGAVKTANERLIAYATEHEEMRGMGTTMVAAVLSGNRLYAANVGDSRLYIAGDELVQITEDHSLVQQMVRMGEISREEAKHHPDKNIITRAVGADRELTVDLFETEVPDGSIVLLCSDGLTNMVDDAALLQILQEPGKELSMKGKQLADTANANGGKDNITVILIQVGEVTG